MQTKQEETIRLSPAQTESGSKERPRKVVVCHQGHENDTCYTENIFEFLSEHGIEHAFINLRRPHTTSELRRCLRRGPETALLGFNSQLDHACLGRKPLLSLARRHGLVIVQWILDHPSERWPEFGHSDSYTSRFLFHAPHAQNYFSRYCCPGAITATAGSVGPNRRSRYLAETEDLSERPINCLIALNVARMGRTAPQVEAEIDSLDPPLSRSLKEAVSAARFDLDGPLERHLIAALENGGHVLDNTNFNRYFRLANDSVQLFRRAEIIRTASQFGVLIQSDASAKPLIADGPANFRQDVSMPETLKRTLSSRAVLSISPQNDSIHDRTCNALNAGCLPILEDNTAHRGLFSHGENALLFRYGDDSLAECLAAACGDLGRSRALALRARAMRDQAPFRFGSFQSIVTLTQANRVEPKGPSWFMRKFWHLPPLMRRGRGPRYL